MKQFMGLTKRNLLVFFKDKQSVVFSLLTSIIVFVLYLLFLKGTFIDAFDSVLDTNEYLKTVIKEDDIEAFVNMMLLVGMLGSALITVPFNCLTTVVRDKENKVDYDISATPVARWQIVLSYFASAALSSCIMTGILLTAGLIISSLQGGFFLDAEDIAFAYLVVIIGSISSTALFMTFMLFFKTSQASGAFFGLLSAASGFVIGAYIPLSQFSEGVRSFCNLFPATHITIMLRNALMNGALERMDSSLGGMDGGVFAESIRESFTFSPYMFGNDLVISSSMIYVLAIAFVSCLMMIVIYSKNYKK